MSKTGIILRNVTSNWIGFVINAAITLVLTPYVLHQLGVARYGIWILTSSLVGYYGFLDLAFRAGVTQYLTRYLALPDYRKASDCISTAVSVLSLLGAVMAVLSVAGAYVAPHFFALSPEMEREAFWCILLVGLCSAVQCVFSPFAGIFWALQRLDLSNLIGIVTRLVNASGVIIALKLGQGLIGVSIAFCVSIVIDYMVRWYISLRLAPELEVSWRRANKERLREICSFGTWYFLKTINYFVSQYIPNILIGFFMPIAAVGHYALAMSLSRQLNSVLNPIPSVMYPAAAGMHARNDLQGLKQLYHRGSRLMLLIMIPAVLGAGFWARDFYRIWIGPSFLSGTPFPSVAALFHILLLGTFMVYYSSIAQHILMGAGRIRMVSTAAFLGSILSVTCSLLLIRSHGLTGVAAAEVIAAFAVDFITFPLMIQHVFGFTAREFIRSSCARPLIAGVLQALVMAGVRLTGEAENFIQLAIQGLAAGAGCGLIAMAVGITREERRQYVVQPIRMGMKRISHSGISGALNSLLDRKP